jgi:Terminase large subunit, T4likevirus-type, N-terminal
LDRCAFAREVGLDPDPWQRDLLSSSSDRVLLNCCRQSGKSTMTSIVALHRALYHPGSLILCLAPALRQSQELFGKVLGFYRDLGRPVSSQAERKLSLDLENGSRIVTLPGSEKTIRGFSGAALLKLDEAARVDDGLYFAVRPMLAVSGGALMMLSTPYGKRGVFFEEWISGAGWERYEVPAGQCPRISEEFLDEERASLPPFIFRQEYECSFEETEDQVFTTDMIDRAVTDEVKPLFGTGG